MVVRQGMTLVPSDCIGMTCYGDEPSVVRYLYQTQPFRSVLVTVAAAFSRRASDCLVGTGATGSTVIACARGPNAQETSERLDKTGCSLAASSQPGGTSLYPPAAPLTRSKPAACRLSG